MPGCVEGTGDPVMNKLDLVPAYMKVISLVSKTGKRNYESMHTCIHNSDINVCYYRK